MIKKLITISVILGFGLSLGLVGTADAAYDELTFGAATSIAIQDLIVSNGSKVKSMVVGATDVTVTLESGSNITFTSTSGQIMQVLPAIGTGNVCDASDDSSLTIIYDALNPIVVLSLTGGDCAVGGLLPTVSTVAVTNATTVTVTMSEKINYASGKSATDLTTAGTKITFAGAAATVSPTAVSTIDGTLASFTLTFDAGVLAGAGIKDDSLLAFPAGILTNGANNLSAVSKVVTAPVDINQLYDFTFAIQTGDNFMSVPYNVKGPNGLAVSDNTQVGLTYVVPNGAIQISTILDSGSIGGLFSSPTSGFDPLYGYYINSTATTSPVYLRLNEDTDSLMPFERTIAAAGWHLIGVASNNVDCGGNGTLGCAANLGDAVILSSFTTPGGETLYDKVMDVAIGKAADDNVGTCKNCTYDVSVYKALLDNDHIVTKAKVEIDLLNKGIEFNHGEAYFIYITGANAKYIGGRPSAANVIL